LGILGKDKKFADSASAKLEGVALGTDWKQYSISLSNKDLSRIKTGFVINVASTGKPMTIYIDDISYVAE
jgi:flagellar motor switch protein FliM